MELRSRKYNLLFQKIFASFLRSSDPENMVLRSAEINGSVLEIDSEKFSLENFSEIKVVSVGKCSVKMFSGLKKILGKKLKSGIIVTGDGSRIKEPGFLFLTGDHPFPGENSVRAGGAVLKFLDSVKESELVIGLISGGASSMVIAPPENIDKEDLATAYRLLINSGASIEEINCVRSHCSQIKGGLAAKRVYPAKVINLVVSDIPGPGISAVGSGPFAWDDTTFRSAMKILNKYAPEDGFPQNIVGHIENGVNGNLDETPDWQSEITGNNRFFKIGDNGSVLKEMSEDMEKDGVTVKVVSSSDSGGVKEKALEFSDLIRRVLSVGSGYKTPVLFLSGGEYTVNVKGSGKGGRNTEFMLLLLKELRDEEKDFFAFSFGSDGRDGPTDAAGAWIDEKTFGNYKRSDGKDIRYYLNNNDSYTFFDNIGQLIKTGRTGTNIMDIRGVYVP